MIGKALSHFRILEKIGEGGMGVVYRARDEQLGRHVALKVLHTEFVTDDERRQRFLREARTAAALTHPNIATVHEVGEHEGVIFIAMELVGGCTLGERIAEQVPPVEECLRLAIEIAEGLARAHQSSIVHRDLKPENVRIGTDGHVKILDFGLAKLYHDPKAPVRDDSEALQTISAAVTRDSRILGTVAYMSPEQARGLEVDARSDVFSFGIVLYELVTGKRPFEGETVTDTLSAILRDPAPPIARFNPKVPVELERILARCLEKTRAARYADAGEVLEDLKRLKRMTDSQPVPLVRDRRIGAGRRWLRAWPVAAGLGAVILAAVLAVPASRWLSRVTDGGVKTLAVLPFENLQRPNDPDRLGQILQELIITDLSEHASLKVLSSQRLFDLQKQLGRTARTSIDRDLVTRVAARAGASVMLTGTLSQLGSTWILTTQLIDLADGSVLESERIDGADLYAMVDDLTTLVRRDLGLVAAESDVAVSERTSASLEAYNAYLHGVDELNALGFDAAARQLERAVELDPAFGRAHYKLAIARWWGGSFDVAEPDSRSAAPGAPLKALLASDVKLTRKDRLLGEALLALVERRFDEAVPRFEEIVGLDAEEKEAWYGLGEARFHAGRTLEARRTAVPAFERAVELDPAFSLAYYHVVDLDIKDRRIDEGMAKVRGFLGQDPGNVAWHQDLARLAVARGDDGEVAAVIDEALRRIDSRAAQRAFLAHVATVCGRSGQPRRMAELLERALGIETEALEERVRLGLAEAALLQGDPAAAETRAREVLAANSHSAPARRTLFAALDRARRFDEAIREARRLVAADADDEAAYGFWAEAAIRSGDHAESEAALGAIDARFARTARTADARRSLDWQVAKARISVADYAGAERVLAGLTAEPTDDDLGAARAFAARGAVALELGRPREAADWFARALERSVDDAEAGLGLARARVELGEFDGAIDAARAANDLLGHDPHGTARLIEALLLAGRTEEVAALTREALDWHSSESARRLLRRELGEAYFHAGRFEDAEREIRAASGDPESGPKAPGYERLLVDVLVRRGKTAEAEAALARALERYPYGEGLDRERPVIQLLAGAPVEAERTVRALLARGPVHSELHALLALSLTEQRRHGEAVAAAREAFARNPGRHNHTVLSWTLIAGGIDLVEGQALAEKARSLPDSPYHVARVLPFVPSAEHCLGRAYLEQNRLPEAVDELARAATLRPDRPSIRSDLERASERRGASGT